MFFSGWIWGNMHHGFPLQPPFSPATMDVGVLICDKQELTKGSALNKAYPHLSQPLDSVLCFALRDAGKIKQSTSARILHTFWRPLCP